AVCRSETCGLAGFDVATAAAGHHVFFPGIGAQGGDAAAAVRAGWRGDAMRGLAGTTGAIVVSSSRAVLYAGAGGDFAVAARAAADTARRELNAALAPG
ncbi:MAG: hypothetical protein ACKVQR_14340, partial [Aquabacterium sp.]